MTTAQETSSAAPLRLDTPRIPPPLTYSGRIPLKALLLDRPEAAACQHVIVGGWVKSAKEIEKVMAPVPRDVDATPAGELGKGRDVSCVEMLQSRIPLIRSIMDVFGGGGHHGQRKKRENVAAPSHNKVLPPKASTAYLLLRDGSCVPSLQVVVDSSVATPSRLMATGTCLLVEGQLERGEGKHAVQLKAEKILHIGTVDFDKYPLSKKRIPLDTLRDHSQFRPRTTTVASVMRIRSSLSFATHSFFNEHGFMDVQVPIITTTDSEGFSRMFSVNTNTLEQQKAENKEIKLDTIYETDGVSLEQVKEAAKDKSNIVEHLKRSESNREALAAAVQDLRKTNELAMQLEAREKTKLGASFKNDSSNEEFFFPFQTYLSVSGRLHLESYASALGNVYSFGPRFVAHQTDSAKHAAEMWMVEVEMAFSQLKDSMNCSNDFFKYLCNWVLVHCSEEMKFVAKRIDNTSPIRLQQIISGSPQMMTYHEAIDVLRKAEDNKFDTNLESGFALTSEHLSYLTDTIYQKPVMIYNYPKEAKPFYVRQNDDGTVAAFDLVLPKLGTIISGSQNEERLNMISSRIDELDLAREKYEWYLDLRRNGTVKNSGFTLRFDLMVLFATGLGNVRDAIPFPRSYGKANN